MSYLKIKSVLFHYCKINDLTLSNLVKKEIHFTPATETNDKKDCFIQLEGKNRTDGHEMIVKEIRKRIYLACFSFDGNNDAMRAYYADREHGMIIRFEDLSISYKKNTLIYVPVTYGNIISKMKTNALLKTCDAFLETKNIKRKGRFTKKIYDELFNVLLSKHKDLLIQIVGRKDKCWEGEKEARLVYFRNDWKTKHLTYKAIISVKVTSENERLQNALNLLSNDVNKRPKKNP